MRNEFGDPFAQEGARFAAVRKRKWIEASGLAGGDHLVLAVECTNEALRATIFIEVGDARLKPLRLRKQKSEQGRLAGAARSDDGKVAEIAGVEIEMVGPERCRLQHGDGIAPVRAARVALRIVVEAGEAGKIRRGD